jgi:hypothetical protein
LGYLLVQLTSLAYQENDMFRLPVITANWVWFATIALAFAFALLAHVVVQRQIHIMDYLQGLKVTE